MRHPRQRAGQAAPFELVLATWTPVNATAGGADLALDRSAATQARPPGPDVDVEPAGSAWRCCYARSAAAVRAQDRGRPLDQAATCGLVDIRNRPEGIDALDETGLTADDVAHAGQHLLIDRAQMPIGDALSAESSRRRASSTSKSAVEASGPSRDSAGWMATALESISSTVIGSKHTATAAGVSTTAPAREGARHQRSPGR